MELTGKKLEETLNAELVGKDVGYSHWKFTNALLSVIRIFAKMRMTLNNALVNFQCEYPTSFPTNSAFNVSSNFFPVNSII